MAPVKRHSRAEQARRALVGVQRDDSDDEVILEFPWEWIYEGEDDDELQRQESEGEEESTPPAETPSKRKRNQQGVAKASYEKRIIGARMGDFECMLGDCVLLKAAENECWVGLIQHFYDEEDGEKMARFLWFNSTHEIRNRNKRRSDALPVSRCPRTARLLKNTRLLPAHHSTKSIYQQQLTTTLSRPSAGKP